MAPFDPSGGGGGGVPLAHAPTHEDGGSDEIDVTNLTGLLATPQTPAAHATTHDAGGADAMAIDAAAGTGSLRTLGTGATNACAGNDARLSDARTPTAHQASHITGADQLPTVTVGTRGICNAIPAANTYVFQCTTGTPGWGQVTNGHVSPTAAIDADKLEAGTTGQILGVSYASQGWFDPLTDPFNLVENAGAVQDNKLARFDGTTGNVIQNGQIAELDEGHLTGVGTITHDTEGSDGTVTGGTANINFEDEQFRTVTLGSGTTTLNLNTPPGNRVGHFQLRVVCSGGAASWSTSSGSLTWVPGSAPTFTNGMSRFVTFFNNGSNWWGDYGPEF